MVTQHGKRSLLLWRQNGVVGHMGSVSSLWRVLLARREWSRILDIVTSGNSNHFRYVDISILNPMSVSALSILHSSGSIASEVPLYLLTKNQRHIASGLVQQLFARDANLGAKRSEERR